MLVKKIKQTNKKIINLINGIKNKIKQIKQMVQVLIIYLDIDEMMKPTKKVHFE